MFDDGPIEMLDSIDFPEFGPLLEASKSYAALKGWRFDPADFSVELGGKKSPCGERPMNGLAGFGEARAEAALAVKSYALRLREDKGLQREYKTAYERTARAAASSTMLFALRALDVLPDDKRMRDTTTCTLVDVAADKLPRLVKKLEEATATDPKALVAANFIADFGMAAGLPRHDSRAEYALLGAFYEKILKEKGDKLRVDRALCGALEPFKDIFILAKIIKKPPI